MLESRNARTSGANGHVYEFEPPSPSVGFQLSIDSSTAPESSIDGRPAGPRTEKYTSLAAATGTSGRGITTRELILESVWALGFRVTISWGKAGFEARPVGKPQVEQRPNVLIANFASRPSPETDLGAQLTPGSTANEFLEHHLSYADLRLSPRGRNDL
jgi:hypothetical protein